MDSVDFDIHGFNLNPQIANEIHIYLSDINKEALKVHLNIYEYF